MLTQNIPQVMALTHMENGNYKGNVDGSYPYGILQEKMVISILGKTHG